MPGSISGSSRRRDGPKSSVSRWCGSDAVGRPVFRRSSIIWQKRSSPPRSKRRRAARIVFRWRGDVDERERAPAKRSFSAIPAGAASGRRHPEAGILMPSGLNRRSSRKSARRLPRPSPPRGRACRSTRCSSGGAGWNARGTFANPATPRRRDVARVEVQVLAIEGRPVQPFFDRSVLRISP